MPSFAIGWEYLTGYAAATNPSNRDRPEWPPHPGRVFLALAAAYFETGQNAAEGAGLRWLETLGDPELLLPHSDAVYARRSVTTYVPVNDKAGPSVAMLQSATVITRSKQGREFARAWVGHTPCFLIWPEAEGAEAHRAALARLCAQVTRIGHSSSLVRMWVADESELIDGERWRADDALATAHCRVVSRNTLDTLPEQTNITRIETYAELAQRIETSEGAELKRAKAEFEQQFGKAWSRRKHGYDAPPLGRPKLGIWRGYRAVRHTEAAPGLRRTIFDTELLVLTQTAGPQLPLESTLSVVAALRGTIMKNSGEQPVPAWVSGHEPDGQPLQSEDDGHLAILPLPFVGHTHADGHLLGMGLAFPRSTTPQQRGRVLGRLLVDTNRKPRDLHLKLGRLGEWTLTKRDWSEPRHALQHETWTAQPKGATVWASVTPLVLDKFPKSDRRADRAAWSNEVCEIIAAACERIGLPRPIAIDVDTTSWHLGSPRAIQKQRPVRGQQQRGKRITTGCGEGFPYYPPKGINAPRPQTHVWLLFPTPVIGPVLLGAGRYRGYGLCMPFAEGSQ